MSRLAANTPVPQVRLLRANRPSKEPNAQPQPPPSDTDKQAAACLQLLVHASECQDLRCSQDKCPDMKVEAL
jgi:hypothetical protein